MTNLTIRNIPSDIYEKLKTLSILERRSINNEILFIIEKGVLQEAQEYNNRKRSISKKKQQAIWDEIAGQWLDDKPTDFIIKEIYETRSIGKNVDL